jgi:serine/threonine-protein kinase RsbW
VSRLRLRAERERVGAVMAWLDARCAALGLGQDVANRLALVCEEVVLNVAGYGGPPVPTIELDLSYAPPTLQLTVTDDGRPFDPTLEAPPALGLELEDRAIGGLGILMIRELMDEVEYARTRGCNRLTLRKRVC